MGDFLRKIQERRINSKYSLVHKIGEGGHGAVYLGRDTDSGEEVALKLEHGDQEPSILREEADRYEEFQGAFGFPQVYWYGRHDDFKIMIFDLLGPSLEDVLVWCGGRFSLKTTLMLADQLLYRLETFHRKGLVHRDIKPQNFLLGTGENGTVVYMADLGIAIEFETCIEESERIGSSRNRLIGTRRFASIRGHLGQTQHPADDLESLLYMLIYLIKGRLPWQGLRASDEEEKDRLVFQKKRTAKMEQLCSDLPQTFIEAMTKSVASIRSLSPAQSPNYESIRGWFRQVANAERIEYDEVFDWIIRWPDD